MWWQSATECITAEPHESVGGWGVGERDVRTDGTSNKEEHDKREREREWALF